MQRMTTFAVVLGLSLAGCKKKASEESGAPAGGTAATGGAPATGGGGTPAPARPSQAKLDPMPALALPDDPARPAKVALGHALFFDQRLSVDGSKSCYSCHLNEDGLGGKDPIAIGPGDKKLTRHSPVLWNIGYQQGAFYWDGRAKTLEEQMKAAWAGGNMGVGKDNLDKKATELAAVKGYGPLFQAAFGDPAVTVDRVAQATAEYMRTIVCADTAYDRFAKGDKMAMSDVQQRGLDLFMGKAQCNACHTPPHFSISMQVDGGVYFNAGIGTDKPEAEVDVGRMSVTNNASDWAAFKVPSLRNVAKSPPYFHDGSRAKLEDAVRYMANGAQANKNLSALLAPKNLSDAEIADLVAFLGALDCNGELQPPKLP